MSTLDTILTRKSVRAYTGEPATAEEEKQVLLAAEAAPIAMGTYDSVHMTVIKDEGLLAKIDAAGGKMFGDPSIKPLYGAPEFVLISAKVPEGDLNGANVAFSNAAIMAENMTLEATELGLGSCLIWGAIRAVNADAALVAELGLPEGFTPCCGVIFGKTDEALAKREIDATRIATDTIA